MVISIFFWNFEWDCGKLKWSTKGCTLSGRCAFWKPWILGCQPLISLSLSLSLWTWKDQQGDTSYMRWTFKEPQVLGPQLHPPQNLNLSLSLSNTHTRKRNFLFLNHWKGSWNYFSFFIQLLIRIFLVNDCVHSILNVLHVNNVSHYQLDLPC